MSTAVTSHEAISQVLTTTTAPASHEETQGPIEVHNSQAVHIIGYMYNS